VISSLRLRMMFAVGLLAVAAVVAVALSARQRTRSEFRHFQALEKISTAPDAGIDSERVSTLLAGRCCDPDALSAAAAALSPNQIMVVADASGHLIAKSGKPLDTISEFRFSRSGEDVAIDATRRNYGGAVSGVSLRFHIPGMPVTTANGSAAYLYVFPFPNDAVERPEALFLGSVDRSLLLTTTLTAAIALIVTWMLTRRIAAPIEELRAAARDLALGNLARRVDSRGSDEIAELGRSFNAMAAELEHQQTLRRNLVHDVAHELRTPLTALRCQIDSVADALSTDPRKAIDGANEEIEHLARLVEDLHELALAEARELRLTICDIPLNPIVVSAARAAGLESDSRLRLIIDESLLVRGDVVRVRQVVLNILSNAARYTPAEGRITVNAFHRDQETVVEVHNTGSKLTTDEIAHVFDRFYRADPSRQRSSGGTGLGLTIVKNIMEAQGGRVWARSDGSGVTFAFALPSRK
jgi:signal transduction histidine kinase